MEDSRSKETLEILANNVDEINQPKRKKRKELKKKQRSHKKSPVMAGPFKHQMMTGRKRKYPGESSSAAKKKKRVSKKELEKKLQEKEKLEEDWEKKRGEIIQLEKEIKDMKAPPNHVPTNFTHRRLREEQEKLAKLKKEQRNLENIIEKKE